MQLTTKDVLRLATIGSVDDGKSTLIGRLLVDTRQLFDDQLDAVAAASEKRGIGDLDLSFVTDGLRAEREQGITIDVAYRYASTTHAQVHHRRLPRTRALHAQHGDGCLDRRPRAGSRRRRLGTQRADSTSPLHRRSPRRALDHRRHQQDGHGRLVASWRSSASWMRSRPCHASWASPRPWRFRCRRCSATTSPRARRTRRGTTGRRFSSALSRPSPVRGRAPRAARLPIQWVLRQPGGGRTYAGMVSGEAFHVGDTGDTAPANIETTIRAINFGGESRLEAAVGLAADLDLADETDAGRGDLIATDPLPRVTKQFEATICWFGEKPFPWRSATSSEAHHQVHAGSASRPSPESSTSSHSRSRTPTRSKPTTSDSRHC